jgi:predicted O-methyltransferase YrrM
MEFATTEMTQSATDTLHAPRLTRTLDRLYRDSHVDMLRIFRVAPLVVPHFFGMKHLDDDRLSKRMRSTYLPVSRSQGEMLYLVARAIDARRIVEFGTSFGISTIYMAAAVIDNGGGQVIGTENEPSKHARALENLRAAGVDQAADVLLGDAHQTLRDVEGPIDMVLLDGWKDGYLDILQLLKPKLRPRAMVLADNIFRFKRALKPYVDYVESGTNGFVSSTLEISDGFEMSVFVG